MCVSHGTSLSRSSVLLPFLGALFSHTCKKITVYFISQFPKNPAQNSSRFLSVSPSASLFGQNYAWNPKSILNSILKPSTLSFVGNKRGGNLKILLTESRKSKQKRKGEFTEAMKRITESLCFCNGVGKSERMKASILSGKGPAMARISVAGNIGASSGIGFLIHRNLLLTTHANLPSVATAESAEIHLQNGVATALFPHRFFITSSVLDLTIVGLDQMEGDTNAQNQQAHYLRTCSKPNLDLGSEVYLLSYTKKNELTIGEAKLVIATDNLIKLSTGEMVWHPGSAGFDVQGNLAFMICDPRKLATSPNSNSSSSSSSWKINTQMQFGIPIPVICDWLNQHWEGDVDKLNKPKLPLIRLMSSGQKSEHSCASLTMSRVFKSTDGDIVGTPYSSKTRGQTGPSSAAAAGNSNEGEKEATPRIDPQASTHVQGFLTPEMHESPKLTSVPIKMNKSGQIQLLHIHFPPRISKATTFPSQPTLLNPTDEMKLVKVQPPARYETKDGEAMAEIASTGSVDGANSEVMSSSSPVEAYRMYNNYEYSSDEETMYSAETAESRNYPSLPKESKFNQQTGRSQSCVSYNRWGSGFKSSVTRRAMLEKQRSLVHGKNVYSQGATSQRSNDYYSPTVSSIMRRRNSSDQQTNKLRPRTINSSPRWMF